MASMSAAAASDVVDLMKLLTDAAVETRRAMSLLDSSIAGRRAAIACGAAIPQDGALELAAAISAMNSATAALMVTPDKERVRVRVAAALARLRDANAWSPA